MQLPIDLIDLGTNYSRSDLGDCSELAASILEHGQQQAVVVRGEVVGIGDRYTLVSGYRRFHAMRFYLGCEFIDARIETGNTPDAILNLVENLQRDSLSFWDECLAVSRAFPSANPTEVSRQLKRSRNWARPRIAVMEMSEEVRNMVRLGQLSASDITTMIEGKTEVKQRRAIKLSKPAEHDVRMEITKLYGSGRPDQEAAARWLCWALGDVDKPQD